jgi:ABC-type transporter Mla subunit MlaD
MTTEGALLILSGAVSAALIAQVVAFWGIHRSIRTISSRLDTLSHEVERRLGPLSERAEELLAAAKPAIEQFQSLQRQVTATAEIVHQRVASMDTFLEEATDSARVQVVRVQDLVDSTATRIEETVERVQHGILSPLTELSALLRGLRVGFNFFFRRARYSQPHQDEEMFI